MSLLSDYRIRIATGARLVRRYLAKMTGLSRAPVTRLLGAYLRGEKMKPKPYRRYRFSRRYTPEEPVLPAVVDETHDTRSGPAHRRFCSGDTATSATPNTNSWQDCRWRNSTVYGRAAPIGSGWRPIKRRDPRK
jgi:hypothetical protein